MSCLRGCCESQREHYLSLRLSAYATPSSKEAVVEASERDKTVKADCAAYRRLVKAGKDPGRIDGSVEVERSL